MVWRPPFIGRLATEDRCHLNGVAVRDGQPAFVTVVGPSEVVAGWREHLLAGGQLPHVPSAEVAAAGLSLPHSPRGHQGQLWLLNSGTGEIRRVIHIER